eukprot:8325356-Prorocentrum_lima.AAC.1
MHPQLRCGGSGNAEDKIVHVLRAWGHVGVAALSPWSRKERSKWCKGDGIGAGEAGEPMHNLDEEGMDHSKQGGPGRAVLFETLERVYHWTGGPRMQ